MSYVTASPCSVKLLIIMSSHRNFTAAFKLKVVAFAEANSKKAAAKYFKVDRRRVQDWILSPMKWLLVLLLSVRILDLQGGRLQQLHQLSALQNTPDKRRDSVGRALNCSLCAAY